METYFDPELNPDPNVIYSIIDMKKGDVTGDGTLDEVYLLGVQPSGGGGPNYFDDITAVIIDGNSKKTTYLRFKYNSGYNPKLVLADFTGDKFMDIFISIKANPKVERYFYYLFSAVNNNPKSLFNFVAFNEFSEYRVIYRDFYIIEVIGVNTNKVFLIDIRTKPKEYLSRMYGPDGKLIEPVIGDVLRLGNLFPIDVNDDGVLELLAFQRIVGEEPTDILGYIQTFLIFNGTEFRPDLTLLGIEGKTADAQKLIKQNR